ncbi:MAG: hypothetical protein ACKO8T_00820, partial [Actinomycetota bacterium]
VGFGLAVRRGLKCANTGDYERTLCPDRLQRGKRRLGTGLGDRDVGGGGELRDIVANAQAQGLMRADLDLAAVAGVHLAMVHGCSMFDLGASSVGVDVLRQVYVDALFALIFN